MIETCNTVPTIQSDGIYDDLALKELLLVTQVTINRARRDRSLRHTQKGSRYLYLGQWVLDWLMKQDEK